MRILLVDDHRMIRDGLRAILEKDGLEIIGEAANGRESIALAERLRPDVVVMDISMPELNGVDATQQMVLATPGIKIIGLSMNSDRRYVLAMFRAGAVGYLLKNSASDELLQAIRTIAAGHKYVSPAIAGIVLDTLLHGAQASNPSSSPQLGGPGSAKALTTREREVLQLVAEGHSSKKIAADLNLAMATVESHRRQIMDKLGLRSIAELTKYAIREGLTSLE